ncbi:hypothetical protein H0H92_012006 [Tricholoma furcatifolium]|nr:hypothetical protein H0H92_012006 [Tricholoma furcatifolium]
MRSYISTSCTPAAWATTPSMINLLPPETITEILQELDWFSLMNVRKTCRYLHDISKTLSVWRTQLRRYISGHKHTPRLEAPLDALSAPELEDWVSRRVSADAGWTSANRKPTAIRMIDKNVSRACLVPGGRWLLIGGGDGAVIAYDLDAPGVQGRLLLELPSSRRIESTCVAVDGDSPEFAFTLAIASNSRTFRDDSVHVWVVRMHGRGRQAYLEARLLRAFEAPSHGIQVFNLTMRDNLVARIMHSGNGACHVDIFDWLQSSSASLCRQHHIRLLPGNRILIFTKTNILVYDVQPDSNSELASLPFLRWQLPCPPGERTANGGISEASINASSTQFTFVCEKPNTIYSLSIPHNCAQFPLIRKIATFPGDYYPAIAVGFEKMFIAFERNWKADLDRLSGSVIRLGIAWSGDGPACAGSEDISVAQGVHSYEYPTEWYVGWPPLLDEGSGRIVQPFGKRGLLVLDTALCYCF